MRLTNSMMLTPCGPSAVPTGGAGVADAAFKATLTRAATTSSWAFWLDPSSGLLPAAAAAGQDRVDMTRSMVVAVCRSHLLDLREREIDGSLSTEDLDQGLESLAVDVDLGDRRMISQRMGRRPP